MRQITVHKFGGAALADADSIRGVTAIVRDLPGAPTVVVSALAGTTDLLLNLTGTAESGELAPALEQAGAFRRRHHEVIEALFPESRRRSLRSEVDRVSDELEALVSALAVLREASPRVRDHVVARGEQLSARIVAQALRGRSCRSAVVDPARY